MAKMGRYCKAYHIARLREYPEWSEPVNRIEQDRPDTNGTKATVSEQYNSDHILYLQEDFTVTDGIFMDEKVIFNQVTPEWMKFCKTNLKFEVPDYIGK